RFNAAFVRLELDFVVLAGVDQARENKREHGEPSRHEDENDNGDVRRKHGAHVTKRRLSISYPKASTTKPRDEMGRLKKRPRPSRTRAALRRRRGNGF